MSDAATNGIFALAGALLGGLLTFLQTAWSDGRQRRREDRTRFHRERREAYVRYMNAAQALALAEGGGEGPARRRSPAADSAAAYNEFTHAHFEVRLLATHPVRDAAHELRQATEEVNGLDAGDDRLPTALQRYFAAFRGFDSAARSELGVGA